MAGTGGRAEVSTGVEGGSASTAFSTRAASYSVAKRRREGPAGIT
eukprot:CAMPEP_0116862220 /NCGR_PEP_ID=MMETSP0418-20121206/23510_1 /TAXON_ID=1158023 /ORGANISM="Astrosyne radiata, Strain 13vi08-1A" /LENGTH=44 /DNA_ID= /DNA_START= /DNA_END= /DNA_ORIENTATION=